MGIPKKIKVKGVSTKKSRFDREGEKEKVGRSVWVRKTIISPFPTNYLPTIPLKISAVIRYYQFKREVKKAERDQRKERDIETSKYSVLVGFLEKEINAQRDKLIENGKGEKMLLIRVSPKFDGVLGRVIKYISVQDNVVLVNLNRNYEKVQGEPLPHLLMIEVCV